MANKPPDVRLTGIRASIPPGYLLGRVSAGIGGVELISVGKAQSAGLIPSTLPGPPTGAAGGDLSGTYPNPTVAQLQGVAVAAGLPSNLAVLLYHTAGATWLPVVLGAVAYSNAYSDLSGLPTIHSVIAGGTAGQVLTKNSGTDYDLVWTTPSSGGGSSGAASIQDDGTNLYIALSDTDGQLVLDGSGDPIFSKEVLPVSSIPNPAGYVTGPYSATVVNKVKGVTDGSTAAAGDAGELLKSIVAFAGAISPVNNTGADITTLTLTPGDWDVSGTIAFFSGSASASSVAFGISQIANTLPAANTNAEGSAEISVTLTGNASNLFAIAPFDVNVTVNTTMHLVIFASFTGGGTQKAWGTIRARRIR